MTRPYRTRNDERDVFRALANPCRRKMVMATLHEDRSFDDLRKLIGRTDATVAGHIRILREARLLKVTRTGRTVTYRTNQQSLRSGAKWLMEAATMPAKKSRERRTVA